MNIRPAVIILTSLMLTNCATPPTSRMPASDHTSEEWTHYAGAASSQKFSYLNGINKSNVKSLHTAWTWDSTDNQFVFGDGGEVKIPTTYNQATPLMVDGRLLTSTPLNQVVAIEPSSGKTLWVFDPETYKRGQPPGSGFVHRGVSYWKNKEGGRVFYATNDDFLFALDAKTGKPISSFAGTGKIDLSVINGVPADKRKYAVTSPPDRL